MSFCPRSLQYQVYNTRSTTPGLGLSFERCAIIGSFSKCFLILYPRMYVRRKGEERREEKRGEVGSRGEGKEGK